MWMKKYHFGSGRRGVCDLKARLEDVRVYKAALIAQEAAAISVRSP